KWVFEALMHVKNVFPFPIIGIDSHNGSEFINDHLYRYCLENKITFTRSRPLHKNDGALVEQKNWSRVRELVGYQRFDTARELELLNRIWELDRGFTNYLLPQQKLVSKTRHGAKVSKKHDKPATAYQKAAGYPGRAKRPIITMNAQFKRIQVMALQRQISALTAELDTLARRKNRAPVPVFDIAKARS
ncbi:integrase, partial [Arthrobacter rhombi]